jgi:hypothetical protein
VSSKRCWKGSVGQSDGAEPRGRPSTLILPWPSFSTREDSPQVHSLAAQLIERMLVEAQTPLIEETSGTTSSATVPVTRTSFRSQRRRRLDAGRA